MSSIDALYDLAQELSCCPVREEPMAKHTSFKVGGNAELFLQPDSLDSLKKLLQFIHSHKIKYTVVGNGSNFLVSDEGIRGAVLCMQQSYSQISLLEKNVLLCQSGASLKKVCLFALEQGLSGLEFAYGIPGTIGGAAFMNAGAYGGEMKDVLLECRHLSEEGEEGALAGDEMKLSYRRSAYYDNHCVITEVLLQLRPEDPKKIKAKMQELMTRRKTKQPLEFPSAGSTFKRPEGNFAGTLIEQCGLKGKTVGGAQVSEKHAGFIINIGGATCQDILQLVRLVQETVKEKTGVSLEMEIRVLR